MVDITVNVIGLDKADAYLAALNPKVREALRVTIAQLGTGFIDYLRATKLSGNPLHEITGALKRSFHYRSSGDISGIIQTDSPYAMYHEYGFHGTETVRAHFRLGYPVREHIRRVDYDGRPYIRPAIEEYLPTVYAEIDKAINEALNA